MKSISYLMVINLFLLISLFLEKYRWFHNQMVYNLHQEEFFSSNNEPDNGDSPGIEIIFANGDRSETESDWMA